MFFEWLGTLFCAHCFQVLSGASRAILFSYWSVPTSLVKSTLVPNPFALSISSDMIKFEDTLTTGWPWISLCRHLKTKLVLQRWLSCFWQGVKFLMSHYGEGFSLGMRSSTHYIHTTPQTLGTNIHHCFTGTGFQVNLWIVSQSAWLMQCAGN